MNCIAPHVLAVPHPAALPGESLCLQCKGGLAGLLLRTPSVGEHLATFILPTIGGTALDDGDSRTAETPNGHAIEMRDWILRVLAVLTLQWAAYLGEQPPALPLHIELGYRGIPTHFRPRTSPAQTANAFRRCTSWLLARLDRIVEAHPMSDPASELLEFMLIDLNDAIGEAERAFPLQDSPPAFVLAHPSCGGAVTIRPASLAGTASTVRCGRCDGQINYATWQALLMKSGSVFPADSGRRTAAILRHLERRLDAT